MSSNLEYPKVCALCGVHFLAKKLSTQYCSHKCSQRAYKLRVKDEKLAVAISEAKSKNKPLILQNTERQEKKSQKSNPLGNLLPILNEKEIISVAEAAILMGVERTTAYRYCVQGKLKCIKMNRKIFIRRKDIEGMFDYAQRYQVSPRAPSTKPKVVKPKAVTKSKPAEVKVNIEPILSVETKTKPTMSKQADMSAISDFYTTAEAAAKYNVCKSAVTKRAASNNVPKIVYQGRTLYSKSHIDALFELKVDIDGISEWYSVDEIKDIYSMSTSGVYTFVSDNEMPRKNHRGKTLYSKEHVDALLAHRLAHNDITEWYSMEEIYEKYGLHPGFVANFVFKNQIPKKRANSKGYYSKTHFDDAIQEKQPINVVVTMESAAEMYAMTYEQISWIVRTNNIKKVKQGRFMKISLSQLERVINPPKIYDNGNK